MQQYADIYFTAKSLYMLQVSPRPSSGVRKTVTAASGDVAVNKYLHTVASSWIFINTFLPLCSQLMYFSYVFEMPESHRFKPQLGNAKDTVLIAS